MGGNVTDSEKGMLQGSTPLLPPEKRLPKNERDLKIIVYTLNGYSTRDIAQLVPHCSHMTVARTIREYQERKWIVNKTGDAKAPKFIGGPNLPWNILEQIKSLDVREIECYRNGECYSASNGGGVPQVEDLPPTSPLPALADILEVTELPNRAHHVGWDLFVTVNPMRNLSEWFQKTPTAKCNGVANRTLRTPATRDPWDPRTFTMHWMSVPGKTESQYNMMTIWFPDVTLEHHLASQAFKGWCAAAVKRIQTFMEKRYGFLLFPKGPHQEPDFEVPVEEDTGRLEMTAAVGKKDDLYSNRSHDIPGVETTKVLKISQVQQILVDNKRLKEENGTIKEELRAMRQEFTETREAIMEVAKNEKEFLEFMKKANPKPPSSSESGGMFR